jgi:hypothetical protein
MILLGEPARTPTMQVVAMTNREPRILLKHIRALTRPRGFESHALRLTSEIMADVWARKRPTGRRRAGMKMPAADHLVVAGPRS